MCTEYHKSQVGERSQHHDMKFSKDEAKLCTRKAKTFKGAGWGWWDQGVAVGHGHGPWWAVT